MNVMYYRVNCLHTKMPLYMGSTMTVVELPRRSLARDPVVSLLNSIHSHPPAERLMPYLA